jgi:hypothetical protein
MAITITIGADPEVFIRNTRTNLFVSAHNFIPGTKKDPFKTTFGAIQKDGVAAEFNIIPAKNAKDFISSVSAGLSYITDTIADANPELAVEIYRGRKQKTSYRSPYAYWCWSYSCWLAQERSGSLRFCTLRCVPERG